MSTEPSESRKSFVAAILPWIVGGTALLVYLLTLNHWASFQGLDVIAQISGLAWQPKTTQPLTWLAFYPFQFLPGTAKPVALNLFVALCGAYILMLLARTVALLPYSRMSEERSGSGTPTPLTTLSAWVPPVIGAIACGLQLSFWERATAVSSEMIDLLIFAYVVRCLFEFRRDDDASWLTRSALVYGMGMANNWGFIGFLPVYLTALIWLKRMTFFDGHFLLRMGLRGIAGLCFYLVLPIANTMSSAHTIGFFSALGSNLRQQGRSLAEFPPSMFIALVLTTMVPILVIVLCRKTDRKRESGDNEFARFVGRASVRLAHGLFFALALWLVLDLPFSPRKIGGGLPLLPFYFLNALVMAYCAGFFLRAGLGRFRGSTGLAIALKLIAKIGAWWVCLMLVVLPIELVWRNYEQIRITNGPQLARLSEQLYENLPAGKCVVLGNSPEQLILLRAALAGHHREKDAVLVDIGVLPFKQYQTFMARQFPSRWPSAQFAGSSSVLDHPSLVDFVARLGAHESMVCINPGFGYYEEPFVSESKGLAHYLKAAGPNKFSTPLNETVVAENERYWEAQWDDGIRAIAERAKIETARKNRFNHNLVGRAFFAHEPNLTSVALCNTYTRALDDWGVQMQRANHWREAGVWFQRALALNPDNLAARINALYNERHERGDTRRLNQHEVENQFREQFLKHPNWGRVIVEGGPVDEPTFLNQTARILLFENSYRQAAADYERCAELAPDFKEPKLWHAQSLLAVHDFNDAFGLTETLLTETNGMDGMQLSQLLFCRATALQALGRTNEVVDYINRFVPGLEQDDRVMSTAVSLCMKDRHYENALSLIDRMLVRHTNDAELLSDKAIAQIKTGKRDAAIATLTTAIAQSPTNEMLRMNRAVAFLESGRLEDAAVDYQEIRKSDSRSRQALFGLCEIDWRKKDTNAAIRHFQEFLADAAPQSTEYQLVSNRLSAFNIKGIVASPNVR